MNAAYSSSRPFGEIKPEPQLTIQKLLVAYGRDVTGTNFVASWPPRQRRIPEGPCKVRAEHTARRFVVERRNPSSSVRNTPVNFAYLLHSFG